MSKEYVERLPATAPEAAPAAVPATAPTSIVPSPACVKLLLRCLSMRREPLAVSREPADWNGVVAFADKHGLTPLLYRRLEQSGARASVPPDVWERMRQLYVASTFRSVRLQRELRPVLQRLRNSGIKVIVLKGAYLAEAIYGDPALRPMVDVDLMVPQAELSRAHSVVHHVGQADQERRDAGPRIAGGGGPELVGGAIDIHWTFITPASRFRLDLPGIWERARPATIAGVGALALSPEDLLLHLCLHNAYVHVFGEGLRHLCDIAETIHRFQSDIGWAQVVERAEEWGASRYVGLALNLARNMLGSAVPENVERQMVPGGVDPRVSEAARAAVLAQAGYGPWVPLFHLRSAVSSRDQVRMIWDRIFPSRDELAAPHAGTRDAGRPALHYARWLMRGTAMQLTNVSRMLRSREDRQVMSRTASLADWLRAGKP